MTVSKGRRRLEATLSSPILSNKDAVYAMVCSQLAASLSSSSPSSCHSADSHALQELAQSRFADVWNLLDLLRSASGEENHSLVMAADDEPPSEGWKLKYDTGQLRVMYREGPKGTPFHTLLAEGLIYSPLTSALCLAWEAPSYNLWWPQMMVPTFKIVECKWVKRCWNGEDLSLIRVKVPWPLAAREVLMCAFELEVFDEELIIVLLHSLPDTSTGGTNPDIPVASPNVVRMELLGGFALQKLSSYESYFRTVANLDIKLEFVPPWLINFISRQLIGLGFKLYQNTLSSIGKEEGHNSRHFKRLIETEPMYNRIEMGFQSRKVEGIAGEVPSQKDAKDKRPYGNHVIHTSVSSESSEEATPSTNSEIAPVLVEESATREGESTDIAEQSRAATVNMQNPGAGVAVDPEVQKALQVLDRMISLVQSRKLGLMNADDRSMPSSDAAVGPSNNPTSRSVEAQVDTLIEHSDNGTQSSLVLANSLPLEQVMDHSQEPNASKPNSSILVLKRKYRWFCFKPLPRCCQ